MKKYIISAGILALAMSATAQDEYEAVKFSQTFQQGTARSAAMGGAFGALGGDISVLSINPAGMSIYRGADVCITPMVINNTVESQLNGFSQEDSKFTMKFASVGVVMGNDRGKTTGFTNFAWGVAYNRLNDFSANEYMEAVNNSSSMLDTWKAWGNLGNWSSMANDLGFQAGLLDRLGGNLVTVNDHEFYTEYPGGYGETQSRSITQKGGVNSWDFGISGAYNDMFFFGASLGVQSINYKLTSYYHEDDKANTLAYHYWDFTEKKKINGGGVNLKMGIIVKPTQFLRFGASFHTPTVYNLTDKSSAYIKREYDESTYDVLQQEYDEAADKDQVINPGKLEYVSDKNTYEYGLVSPMRGILSAAFIVPGYGLLSFDYESVNYSKCKYQGSDFGDEDEDWMPFTNGVIKKKAQKTNNFRLGLEGLAGPLSIRAGYALYGNPYKFVSGNKQRQILSFGLGLKADESIYFDLTATYHIYQTDAVLYEGPDMAQMYSYDNRYLNVLLTFGVRL